MKKTLILFALASLCMVGCNSSKASSLDSSDSTWSDSMDLTWTEEVVLEPTCTTDGILRHNCKEKPEKSYDETIPALGHNYDEESIHWDWGEDYSTAVAEFTCKRCEDHIHFDGEIETTHTDPTCDKKGNTTYVASITYNDKTFTDTQIVYEEELGHQWGEYVRDEDGKYMVSHCMRDGCNEVKKIPIVKVFLLAGQSNAVGHSYAYHLKDYISDELYQKYKKGIDGVYAYFINSPFSENEHKFNDDFEKVKLGMGKIGTAAVEDGDLCFGPEVGFAEQIHEAYPDENIYIIKSATGASTLYARWHTESSLPYLGKTEFESNNLYVRFLQTIDEGMALLKQKNLYPEIVGLNWMQGENDGLGFHEHYSYLWNNFIKDLGNYLQSKNYLTPNGLATIDGGIIPSHWTNSDSINKVKETYANAHSKGYYISVDDESIFHTDIDNTDTAHLDATSMIALGKEMGKCADLVIKDLKNEATVHYEDDEWDGYSYDIEWQGLGTLESPYLIENVKQFMGLAYQSRFITNFSDKYFKITKDIDLSNYIDFGGIASPEKPFAGTFDGDDHTITIRTSNDRFSALFRAVSGEIKNFTLRGSVCGTKDSDNKVDIRTGAVVGELTGSISHVKNYANLSINTNAVNAYHYGGVIGYTNAATIEYVENYGTVSVSGYRGHTVGGIVGYSYGHTVIRNSKNYGDIFSTYETGGIAGIAGTSDSNGGTEIIDCENHGTIYGQSINYIKDGQVQVSSSYSNGGIVGVAYSKAVISGCINEGKVTGKGNLTSGGIGGIAGKAFGCTFTNCTNAESAIIENSGPCTGGIIGLITTSTSAGSTEASVSNCINLASISTSGTHVGGIIGCAKGSTTNTLKVLITGCSNGNNTIKPTISGTSYVGGIVGRVGDASNTIKSDSLLSECNNYGEIIATSYTTVSGVNSVRLGGIVGMSYCSLKDCNNYNRVFGSDATYGGTPDVDAGTEANYRIGYIIGYKTSVSNVTNCNNYYVAP